jgi:hypothetical protein
MAGHSIRIQHQPGRQELSDHGPSAVDSISANLPAPNAIQSARTKIGKAAATATTIVSNDGKVLTITTKGTHAQRKHFTKVNVHDKQ